MSKKKNKKKSKFYTSEYSSSKKSKKKDKKKDKKIPGMKDIRPSLDKKEVKNARKIVTAPVEVPKDFLKIRVNCNHAGKLMTPAEFKEMTPAYAAYTPMLDRAIETFGEEHVHVCRSCYDIVVDPECMDPTGVQQSIVTLYVAANRALCGNRLKQDEIKDIAKMRDALSEWAAVVELMIKAEEREERATTPADRTNGLNSAGTFIS